MCGGASLIHASPGPGSVTKGSLMLGPPPPSSGGRNPEVDFRGERRTNASHVSSTDSEARLATKSPGQTAKFCYLGHVLMDNRHGLVAAPALTPATGTAEREAAMAMLDNEAYRRLHGIDNPNLPLLRELHEQGVLLVVCGQTMVGMGMERSDFPPFVKVSRAATVARVILAAEGYVFNPM